MHPGSDLIPDLLKILVGLLLILLLLLLVDLTLQFVDPVLAVVGLGMNRQGHDSG
jgi:hypothetical protein